MSEDLSKRYELLPDEELASLREIARTHPAVEVRSWRLMPIIDELRARRAVDAAITALREAWLDIPWEGQVDKGDGHWIQTLVNAATAIVDPDGKLRADPDAQRRGKIAEYRRRHERAKEQMSAGEKFGLSAEVEKWRVIRDEAAAASRDEFGIYLDAPEPK
jgi:hypothetical protein